MRGSIGGDSSLICTGRCNVFFFISPTLSKGKKKKKLVMCILLHEAAVSIKLLFLGLLPLSNSKSAQR